ncbi:hypothetical protein AS029_06900 [Microbacterium enclense]|nr:hypothetical protein AS029_06900 [Microbacterium enclense]
MRIRRRTDRVAGAAWTVECSVISELLCLDDQAPESVNSEDVTAHFAERQQRVPTLAGRARTLITIATRLLAPADPYA